MSSPSALLKVNYLVIRHLHFRNTRGDLQEGHVYAKRLRGYTFRSHFSLCSSTKMPILCSKCPKMRVPDPKSAQKLRFCARIGQRRGFQTPKAHKNSDFELEMPEIGGSKGKKRTKMPILCAFLFREAAQCGPRCLRPALGTAQLWSNHLRPVLRLASGLVANEPTANEPTASEPTVCGADCLRTDRLRG